MTPSPHETPKVVTPAEKVISKHCAFYGAIIVADEDVNRIAKRLGNIVSTLSCAMSLKGQVRWAEGHHLDMPEPEFLSTAENTSSDPIHALFLYSDGSDKTDHTPAIRLAMCLTEPPFVLTWKHIDAEADSKLTEFFQLESTNIRTFYSGLYQLGHWLTKTWLWRIVFSLIFLLSIALLVMGLVAMPVNESCRFAQDLHIGVEVSVPPYILWFLPFEVRHLHLNHPRVCSWPSPVPHRALRDVVEKALVELAQSLSGCSAQYWNGIEDRLKGVDEADRQGIKLMFARGFVDQVTEEVIDGKHPVDLLLHQFRQLAAKDGRTLSSAASTLVRLQFIVGQFDFPPPMVVPHEIASRNVEVEQTGCNPPSEKPRNLVLDDPNLSSHLLPAFPPVWRWTGWILDFSFKPGQVAAIGLAGFANRLQLYVVGNGDDKRSAPLENGVKKVESVETFVEQEEDPFTSIFENQLDSESRFPGPLADVGPHGDVEDQMHCGGNHRHHSCLRKGCLPSSRPRPAKAFGVLGSVRHCHCGAVDCECKEAVEVRRKVGNLGRRSLKEIPQDANSDPLAGVGNCSVCNRIPWTLQSPRTQSREQPDECVLVADLTAQTKAEDHPHGQYRSQFALALKEFAVFLQRVLDQRLSVTAEDLDRKSLPDVLKSLGKRAENPHRASFCVDGWQLLFRHKGGFFFAGSLDQRSLWAWDCPPWKNVKGTPRGRPITVYGIPCPTTRSFTGIGLSRRRTNNPQRPSSRRCHATSIVSGSSG